MPEIRGFSPNRPARRLRRLCLSAALCAAGASSAAARAGEAACAPRFSCACAWESAVQAAGEEKESRTPAQRKIDSQLLYALYERRGESARRGTPKSDVEVDERGRVLVDIRARVSKGLLARVRRLGGEILSTSKEYNTVLARFPLERLEALAARDDVHFIGPASQATTN